jgi:hypothetical protein
MHLHLEAVVFLWLSSMKFVVAALFLVEKLCERDIVRKTMRQLVL